MRPSRSSTRLAVPAFPDSYGPRYIRERSHTRRCCRSGPIPTLGLRRKGVAMGPPPSPKGAAFRALDPDRGLRREGAAFGGPSISSCTCWAGWGARTDVAVSWTPFHLSAVTPAGGSQHLQRE
jgi:hypothetical protein